MTGGLSETEAVRLTVLDAIAAGTSITSFRKLPLAGRRSEPQVDRVLVNVVLTELEQAGLVVCFGARDDVGEHLRPGEQTWVMTAAGAAELDRLRERARGSSGSAETKGR